MLVVTEHDGTWKALHSEGVVSERRTQGRARFQTPSPPIPGPRPTNPDFSGSVARSTPACLPCPRLTFKPLPFWPPGARLLRMAPPATSSEKCTAGAAVKLQGLQIGCCGLLVWGMEGPRPWLGAARMHADSRNLKSESARPLGLIHQPTFLAQVLTRPCKKWPPVPVLRATLPGRTASFSASGNAATVSRLTGL